jgi:L-asparaginase
MTWRDHRAESGLRVSRLETRVALLQAYTGIDRSIAEAHFGGDTRGVAVIAFGRGNVPPVLVPIVREAVARNVLVTISSRCLSGRVAPRYGYDGGGLDLARAGARLAGDLPGAKARLLQMVALGGTETIEEAMQVVALATDSPGLKTRPAKA